MANKIININNKKATVNGSWLMLDPGLRVLTLHTVGNGTVTATKLSGYPGETATITPTYETYNRFSGYELSGAGSIQNNVYTFGNENADLSAVFKPNAFTAVGLWEKGSDIVTSAKGSGNTQYKSVNLPIVLKSSTGDIPASWHSTSNRWNPSNASAYSINVRAAASFSMTEMGYLTACIRQNNSNHNTVTTSYTGDGTKYYYYSQTYNTTAQSNIIISAYLLGKGYNGGWGGYTQYAGYCRYLASGTTGTWTATGIAP